MSDRSLLLAVGLSAAMLGGGAAFVLCEYHTVASPTAILNVAEPTLIERFTVRASGAIVWEIDAIGSQSVADLEYGQIPAGFRQVVPKLGLGPRALKKGERVITVRYAQGFAFRHSCIAESGTRVTCGSWTYGPLSSGQ